MKGQFCEMISVCWVWWKEHEAGPFQICVIIVFEPGKGQQQNKNEETVE